MQVLSHRNFWIGVIAAFVAMWVFNFASAKASVRVSRNGG